MATSSESAEQYRSRVLTGDLPEGFLQLDSNHHGNPAGALTQQQPTYQPNVPMQVVSRIRVTVAQAKLAKNYGLTRMDPYCRIRIGHHVFETPTATNGSINPRWNKTVTCPISRSTNTVYIEIFDEKAFSPDSQIAWGLIKIKEDLPVDEAYDHWHPLSGKQGDDKEGMINVIMSITESREPVPATPVMIFPQHYAYPAPQVYYPPVPYAMPQQLPPPRAAPPVQVRPEDVKNIKDMFPDMDEEIIKSVLEASGGNVEAALNHLLSMNEK